MLDSVAVPTATQSLYHTGIQEHAHGSCNNIVIIKMGSYYNNIFEYTHLDHLTIIDKIRTID